MFSANAELAKRHERRIEKSNEINIVARFVNISGVSPVEERVLSPLEAVCCAF